MPTYKYQAVLPTGVSIFGIFDAADLNVLSAYLTARNMTLVNASEMSINAALTASDRELPRMLQLRIGDRLREALLTDMPAHEAVRAVAEEPFEHPLLMAMPWLFFITVFGSLVLTLLAAAIPEGRSGIITFAVSGLVVVGTLWLVAQTWLVAKPRRVLLRIAASLERGDDGTFGGLSFLPRELRAVMDTSLDSRTKATSIAELAPTLTGMQLQAHQFAVSIVGPMIALALVFIGMHVLLLSVVPQFAEIFMGFGVELPALTIFFVALSNTAVLLGLPGLMVAILLIAATMIAIYALLVMPRTAEIWEAVPGLGLSVRWLMQARVSRMLGILIRNRVAPAEAIAIASKASGFQSVAEAGQYIAKDIAAGNPGLSYMRQLSGLPLSLLYRVSANEDSEAARQETAQAFQNYATALEQASAGNGSSIAIIVEFLIVISSGCVVGLMVLSLFMPLIKLLNDLSMIVWRLA